MSTLVNHKVIPIDLKLEFTIVRVEELLHRLQGQCDMRVDFVNALVVVERLIGHDFL